MKLWSVKSGWCEERELERSAATHRHICAAASWAAGCLSAGSVSSKRRLVATV
jgi:hypothetical protein